jgi:predicted O-methyltransferase YrrM
LDERLLRYIRELYAPEDEVVASIRVRSERAGLPDVLISPDQAQIIAVLLRAIAARRVLEIGTLGGYSGVWIARALGPDGRLTTVEADPDRAAFARESFEQAGVSGRVTVIEGRAIDVMRDLEPAYDAIFLDADKEPLPAYFRASVPLLRVGGLLLCDNVFIHGRVVDEADRAADVEGVRAFNRLAAADPRLESGVIPVRDGLAVSVKVNA